MSATTSHQPTERVTAYVDGFNLYYGLRAGGLRRFYWLDVQALSRSILHPNQRLTHTKYFTARITGARKGDPPKTAVYRDAKRRRQTTYLEALSTLADFELLEGHFLQKPVHCKKCKRSWFTHEEKMTDVQIATRMLDDGFNDRFDTALLISADSDLVPPTETILRLFPGKRVVVARPPNRQSTELDRAASASFTIGRAKLRQSQFPNQVTKPDGFVLERPREWRDPPANP